ncbi:TolB family protein [Shewanella maritima]|uniref:TolB family protein n=1 Tax=Shewanella maritima TaxID=2520507 RepID=UPI003735A1A4
MFRVLLVALVLSFNLQASTLPYFNAAAENQAVEFAPDVISTKDHFEINTVFNQAGDNVIFARCHDDFSMCTMMQSDYKNGQWQAPTALSISGDYLDADPFYSSDYSQLYFVSKRPIPNTTDEAKEVNIWRSTKKNGQWLTAEYLADINSEAMDLYPSLTDSGDLYFPSFRNNERAMYVAKPSATGFTEPKALPSHIYGESGSIGDSAVSRDGNTIIFSLRGRADSVGNGDLYISTKTNGQWSVAKSLGNKVNTAEHEFTPIISPDGQYLFFTRIENGRGNLYQIKLASLLNAQ